MARNHVMDSQINIQNSCFVLHQKIYFYMSRKCQDFPFILASGAGKDSKNLLKSVRFKSSQVLFVVVEKYMSTFRGCSLSNFFED